MRRFLGLYQNNISEVLIHNKWKTRFIEILLAVIFGTLTPNFHCQCLPLSVAHCVADALVNCCISTASTMACLWSIPEATPCRRSTQETFFFNFYFFNLFLSEVRRAMDKEKLIKCKCFIGPHTSFLKGYIQKDTRRCVNLREC